MILLLEYMTQLHLSVLLLDLESSHLNGSHQIRFILMKDLSLLIQFCQDIEVNTSVLLHRLIQI